MSNEEWVICSADGRWFMGRRDLAATDFYLVEAYQLEYTTALSMGPQGVQGVMMDIRLLPLFLSAGTVKVTLRPAVTVLLRDLEDSDARELLRKVDEVKEQQNQIRGKRGGITLASSMPREGKH